jgi:hypothetical protein
MENQLYLEVASVTGKKSQNQNQNFESKAFQNKILFWKALHQKANK